MQQTKPHADLLGRVIGMLILLAGMGLLAFAFKNAYTLFSQPISGLGFAANKTAATPAPLNIGAAVFDFVRELVLLGFMTTIGSIASGKGIALYLGAVQWGEPKHARVDRVEPAQPASAPSSTEPSKTPAAKPQNG
jgi:hypothetical protein